MSDTTPAPAEEATPTAPTEAPKDAPAQDTDWKAEARKWESRAKENSDAATKLAEIEDANKTEMQRATERAEAAERERDATKAEAERLRVFAKHSIPEEYQDLVLGTGEQLEANAERIASLIQPTIPGPVIQTEGTQPNTSAGPSDWLRDQFKK
ncbi:hypothetical protein [Pseudoclavibacter terrae]|uniref:DUF4355 domain-containing protein n=1 Tax=Pseudoclavibacter terrae TaxID=1530195 RepID=A0A7J5B954_9MICO|nr:hypothetical protein [Pseudoclavibacter terrae]KAB1639860.1 hypothetical protein F8O03_06005 [Pseudoclavibacter terrae]